MPWQLKTALGLHLGQRHRDEAPGGTQRERSHSVLRGRRDSLFIEKRKDEISNPWLGRSKLQNTKLSTIELSGGQN